MSFNSIQFAIFFPIVFLLYWFAFGRNYKQQNLFVVVASYVFYGCWNWRLLGLIALTSGLSWLSGVLISKEKELGSNRAKGWLTTNIIINLGILALFKYYNFFVESLCQLIGCEAQPHLLHLLLPVGISFYTFQALSYSIDVYRGRLVATKDPIAFFAYVSFFPQLVAGPIERATNLLPQFENARKFDYDEAVDGMRRIIWGLFKKIVVADNCALYVDEVWKDYSSQTGSTLALAAVLFAFQIYGDFSGYSDIAIGSARLFGIRLKDNFISPYFSRNVAEFWKRWHISLNTWFVDYVYIPLGGSRAGRYKTIRNTFAIFLLSGLWHGANWTYVFWGLYHALLFIPLIVFSRTKKYQALPNCRQIPQILLTFLLVCFGWIIFRAPSLADAIRFVSYIFSPSFFSIPWLMNKYFYIPLFISLVILLGGEWLTRGEDCSLNALKKRDSLILSWSIYLLLIGIIAFCGCYENIQFIYFQF